MARRKHGKMALYEAMSKAQGRPGYGRTLEKIREQRGVGPEEDHTDDEAMEAATKETVEETAEPVAEPQLEPVEEPLEESEPEAGHADEVVTATGVKWWRKPRVVQINAGRVEFSMPYPLVIALVLGFVLAVLVAFQLGQRYYMVSSQQTPVETPTDPANGLEPAGANPLLSEPAGNVRASHELSIPESPGESADTDQSSVGRTTPPAPKGDNAIILVEYSRERDLQPVVDHFRQFGVETEVVQRGGRYFLQTKARFEGASAAARDALMKIREVGARYKGKAPDGYETFAPHYFKDAYLKKVEN